jgi:hypothetical protein
MPTGHWLLCRGTVDDCPLWSLVTPKFQGYFGDEQSQEYPTYLIGFLGAEPIYRVANAYANGK